MQSSNLQLPAAAFEPLAWPQVHIGSKLCSEQMLHTDLSTSFARKAQVGDKAVLPSKGIAKAADGCHS